MQYATALLHNRDPEQAETAAVILKKQLLTHQDDPQLYELYARSSNVAGDDVRAKEAIAETYYLRGSVHEAAMQLQELVARDDLDYYQRARITARINQMRTELAATGEEDS
jgi:predicted Zn-dependent protease